MKEDLSGPLRRALAVTGGIGSGKSRVARWLARECGFSLFDADDEVRLLLNTGAPGWQLLRAWLSPDYFGDEGSLLKAKLRQAIFADEAMRQAVERDIHPLVLATLQVKVAGSTTMSLVEVPLLYEAGWQNYFVAVLVVSADESVCRARVMARDGIDELQALAAIRAQMPIAHKLHLADYAVDNNGAWSSTLQHLEEIKNMWRCQYGGKKA